MFKLAVLVTLASVLACCSSRVVKRQAPIRFDFCDAGTVAIYDKAIFEIETPNYGYGNYYNNLDCSVVLRTGIQADKVVIEFLSSDLEDNYYCSYDKLLINGVPFCGTWPAGTHETYLIPQYSRFTLRLNTDSSVTRSGALIRVSVEAAQPGETVYQATGGVGSSAEGIRYEPVVYDSNLRSNYIDRSSSSYNATSYPTYYTENSSYYPEDTTGQPSNSTGYPQSNSSAYITYSTEYPYNNTRYPTSNSSWYITYSTEYPYNNNSYQPYTTWQPTNSSQYSRNDRSPDAIDICSVRSIDIDDGASLVLTTTSYGYSTYNNNEDCSTTLVTASRPLKLSLTFSSFSLEPHSNCEWDFFCFNGLRACGSLPAGQHFTFLVPAYSSSTFKFKTDSSVTNYGAQVSIQVEAARSNEHVFQPSAGSGASADRLLYESVYNDDQLSRNYRDKCAEWSNSPNYYTDNQYNVTGYPSYTTWQPSNSSWYPSNSTGYPYNTTRYPGYNSTSYPYGTTRYPAFNSTGYPYSTTRYPSSNSTGYQYNTTRYPYSNSTGYPYSTTRYPYSNSTGYPYSTTRYPSSNSTGYPFSTTRYPSSNSTGYQHNTTRYPSNSTGYPNGTTRNPTSTTGYPQSTSTRYPAGTTRAAFSTTRQPSSSTP